MQTLQLDYLCDMSAYGATTLVPMKVSVQSAPASVTVGTSAPISLTTQAFSTGLGSDANMQKVAKVSFSASETVDDAGTSVTGNLASTAPAAVTTAGDIPASSLTGKVTLAKVGTAVVGAPTPLTILPLDAQGAQLTAITCHAIGQAPNGPLKITVAAPPVPQPPATPVYSCTFSVTGQPSSSASGPIPMSLRVSGKLTTGSTDTITWVTPSIAQGGLGGPWTGASELVLQGSLPVTGAQHGSVTLFRATKDVGLTVLKVTGSLFLSQPGTTYVHLPSAVKLTVSGKGPNGHTLTVVIACTSKSPSVGLTLKVTGNPVQPPTTNGSATPVPTGTGTPVGAPNTGGGRPASNLPLVAGGAALLAVGAGLAFTARRRRHSEN
jgi:hypothetical protein